MPLAVKRLYAGVKRPTAHEFYELPDKLGAQRVYEHVLFAVSVRNSLSRRAPLHSERPNRRYG